MPSDSPKPRRGRPQKPVESTTFAGKIGKEIRSTRERKALSVEHCATAAEVSPPTWYHFESGRSIGLDKLPRIAAALSVSVRSLIPADE